MIKGRAATFSPTTIAASAALDAAHFKRRSYSRSFASRVYALLLSEAYPDGRVASHPAPPAVVREKLVERLNLAVKSNAQSLTVVCLAAIAEITPCRTPSDITSLLTKD